MNSNKPILFYGTMVFAIAILLKLVIPTTATEENTQPITSNADSSVTVKLHEDALPQHIKTISINDEFDFAGEKVPVEIEDVRERLERELTVNSYYHSSTILNIKRSSRYFPMMKKILTEYEVPHDFLYVAVAESSLDNVRSPAGARGFWQIMPSVARSFGLTINAEIDERYNVEKATEAACKLILDYKRKFKTWTNAAGAYNIGEGNFKKETIAQKETDYYNMNFGSETNRYVFRVLALKEILKTPERFGFDIPEEERYAPIDNMKVVEVDKSISNLADFAHEHGMTYRNLKVFNPWLLSSRLSVPSGKTYKLLVPSTN
ncbi:lytic transglycosylase domain-containing protein [Membranihabitans marinus]|uniref:lytic transglycosylase domain-containing protein n=1 Tax=Membranihabitans marinus TaxID=1227546 RepID=UPI001F3742BD|nr:lytic transglycosylase domain-containing protein [Membranihabitans marinus]